MNSKREIKNMEEVLKIVGVSKNEYLEYTDYFKFLKFKQP